MSGRTLGEVAAESAWKAFAGHTGHTDFIGFDDLTPAEHALWLNVAFAVIETVFEQQAEMTRRKRLKVVGDGNITVTVEGKTPVDKKKRKRRT